MIKIRESLSFGFNTFKKNWPPFVVLTLSMAVVSQAPHMLWPEETFFSAADLISNIATAIIGLGFTTLSFKVLEGKKVNFADIFKDSGLLMPYVLVSVSYTILIQIGFVLLVIPGLIILARLFAAPYLVVDKKMSYMGAFKKSWELTHGKTLKLIRFNIAAILVVVVGMLAFLVGALVAIPTVSIATAYVYRKISS